MMVWTVPAAALASVFVVAVLQPSHLDAVRARTSIETAITLFAVASAALLLARFNHTRSLRDLALLSACAAISVTQLAFGALPALGGSETIESSGAARLACEVVVALAFAAAALAPNRTIVRPRRAAAATGAVAIGAVLLAQIVQRLAGFKWGPTASHAGIAAAARYPVALAVHVGAAAVLLVAAIGFGSRMRPRDHVHALLTAASLFLAAATVQYLTMPSTAADWVTPAIVLQLLASAGVLTVAIMRYSESRRATAAQALNRERQRIARDLHDGLAQDLAFIVAQTQRTACALGPDHPLSVAARGALAVSRGAINDLSCSTAPLTGAALHQLAEELQGRSGVTVKVRIAGEPETESRPLFDADGREHLVRIAREAIVNATRHGGAHRIDVALERRMDGVRMCVRDDGCGIGGNPADRPNGFGLPTMRSRAAALGGQLTARELPEGGTEIEVQIPGKAPDGGRAGSQAVRLAVARLPTVVAAALMALVSVTPAGSAARQVHPQRSPSHARHRIWVPAPHSTWQWQLTTPVDTSVPAKVYDIDLFDNPASVVATLHREGRRVVCYLDAGTYENYRPDANQFPKSLLGSPNGWPGERWLDIRRLSVLAPIMRARFELCKHKGFDGVEADNVDGYQNGSGFRLTASDQLKYNKWLAHTAHSLGLSIALKNDVGQIAQLEPYFDFELDEQCFEYSECSQLHPFVAAHKAVFEVEYNLAPSQFCASANADGFMAMRKDLNLDAKRRACWH